ncbi:patatin-like phospholipase family protein [Streptomyces sp. CA-111067]|uniref:patatin-like phospholipase family protein n=1 Tax=Streptomyces sp. CA-111067 TaxID=3240046 RepID=UPI003D95CB10
MRGTALVIGGGGFTAAAWEIGVLKGLADAGCDLSEAGLVVGTSAGSVTGARIAAGTTLDVLYEEETSGRPDPLDLHISLATTARYLLAALGARSSPASARRLGRFALAARTVTEDEVHEAIGKLLPVRDWPRRPLLVAAVDTATGEVTAFDAASGTGLPLAVAASCAVPGIWPPITAAGTRWIDGGVRSSVNAGLAQGCERAVVLAPIPNVPGPGPKAADEARALERSGTRTALLVPDRAARRAFGRNPLDARRRPAVARAGHAQGIAFAGRVTALWQD